MVLRPACRVSLAPEPQRWCYCQLWNNSSFTHKELSANAKFAPTTLNQNSLAAVTDVLLLKSHRLGRKHSCLYHRVGYFPTIPIDMYVHNEPKCCHSLSWTTGTRTEGFGSLTTCIAASTISQSLESFPLGGGGLQFSFTAFTSLTVWEKLAHSGLFASDSANTLFFMS